MGNRQSVVEMSR
ncbi:hypothetical protein CAEBREN_28445 [Caenorhabditis brenneri]|uniref:Uncharacterized protein n=1 Tax=Caenorhabditis brenneri TaxID=135651 RepID=G0P2W8_CAEBE|nr:hypothetical protein CAEBREN_28445 [Caenorhabditis brenneri]